MRNDSGSLLLAYLVIIVIIVLSFIFADLTTKSYSQTSLELKGQVLTVNEGNEVTINGISNDESLDVRIRMKDENLTCYLVLKKDEQKTVINNEGCSLVYPLKNGDTIFVEKTSDQKPVEFSFETKDGNVYLSSYNLAYYSVAFTIAFVFLVAVLFFLIIRS